MTTYSFDELCEKVGLTKNTLNVYLCREEFSHIDFFFKKSQKMYINVTKEDIESLKFLKLRRNYIKKDLQEEIIKHYGEENQFKKLIEELRELEDAILYDFQNTNHVIEEIADVVNLIEQIVMFKNWETQLTKIKNYKIKRQINRMKENESN